MKRFSLYNILDQNLSDVYISPGAQAGELKPFYGKKHTETFKKYLSESRKGKLNPMFGLPKSTEFNFYATRDRSGANNPRAKQTTLTNDLNGETFVFDTFKKCRQFLKASPNAIIESGTLFRNQWQIKSIIKNTWGSKKPQQD